MAVKKETENEEVKIDIPLKGVHAKLTTARVALSSLGIKKSGQNDFAHFNFFQLKDFLPEAQRIFAKLGLYSHFELKSDVIYEITRTDENSKVMSKEPIIKEIARLDITDVESKEVVTFKMDVEPVMIGNNTKQNVYQAAGGRSTYYKRYLYRDALEIEEDDESDAVLGQEDINYQVPQTSKVVAPKQAKKASAKTIQENIVAPANNVPVPNEIPVVNEMGKDSVLTDNSRVEIMNLVQSKGLDGSIIINYCMERNLEPASLLEGQKQDIINYINSL